MIWNVLIGFFLEIFKKAIDLVSFIPIPTMGMRVLSPILAYGNAIIGIDLIAVIIGSFVFWLTFKASVGLVLFLYEKIPFN